MFCKQILRFNLLVGSWEGKKLRVMLSAISRVYFSHGRVFFPIVTGFMMTYGVLCWDD